MRAFSFILLGSVFSSLFGQDSYLEVSDGAKLFVQEAGQGQAIVFIPGWTMTHRFFEKQIDFFSKNYHVLAYDPRGQGRSDESALKNTYAVHARDLREILMKKDLDGIVLVGWSSGCLTIWEYIREFGYERIDKVVYIDECPKWIGDEKLEWVYGKFDDYRSSIQNMISGASDPDDIIDWMLKDPIDSITREWMRNEIKMTNSNVALSLYLDGMIGDYYPEVKSISQKNPSMFLLRTDWFDKASGWLEKNSPYAATESISSHAMFLERPNEFNKILTKFLVSD
ncbi:MAG: alpha/beta hydrolase [Ekhidna sp.]|nr:alpha/beta hydrolase [Ekhidna sp.]